MFSRFSCISFDVVLRTVFAIALLQLALRDGLDNVWCRASFFCCGSCFVILFMILFSFVSFDACLFSNARVQ